MGMNVRMRIKIIGISLVILLSGIVWHYQTEDSKWIDLINQELKTTPTAAGQKAFDLLDASKFTDSMYPWIGFPVIVLTEAELFGENAVSMPPDEITLKQRLMKYKEHKRIIFYLPSWHALVDGELDVMLENYIEWHVQLLTWARDVLPNTNLGIFALPRSPSRQQGAESNDMQKYQDFYLGLNPVFKAVDTVPLFSSA